MQQPVSNEPAVVMVQFTFAKDHTDAGIKYAAGASKPMPKLIAERLTKAGFGSITGTLADPGAAPTAKK